MKIRKLIIASLALFLSSPIVEAKYMGALCWELQPFETVICFDIESIGTSFLMAGSSTSISGISHPVLGSAIVDSIDPTFIYLTFRWFGDDVLVLIDTSDNLNGGWSFIGQEGEGKFKFLGTPDQALN